MEELYEHERDAFGKPSCFYAKNNAFHAHFHSSIELVYGMKGTMNAVVDGKEYQVQKDRLLIVSNYEVHRYDTPEESEVIITIFPLSFVPSLEKKLAQKTFAACLYHDLGQEFRTLFTMLSHSFDHLGEEALRGYYQLILGLLIDRVGVEQQPMPLHAGLSRNMLSYVQNHYTASMSMGEMANHFGYSRSYLSKIFKENFNCNFLDYVNTLRLRKATHLLENKETSILDISMASGFDCVRTFYRAFKKQYGMTPSQYAKNHEETNHSKKVENVS